MPLNKAAYANLSPPKPATSNTELRAQLDFVVRHLGHFTSEYTPFADYDAFTAFIEPYFLAYIEPSYYRHLHSAHEMKHHYWEQFVGALVEGLVISEQFNKLECACDWISFVVGNTLYTTMIDLIEARQLSRILRREFADMNSSQW